jgi:type VI secretion system ImpC/EvpB family protein/type VI secretion system ImpB/VipA family protein
MNFELGTPPRGSARRDPEKPLRVLVLGNFSGNVVRKAAGAPFTAHRLDLDNFDAVMEAMSPQLEISAPGLGEARVRLDFGNPDDFHPDAIFRECAIFTALREKRALLASPATFSSTAAQMLESGKSERPLSSAEGEMFERLLGSRGTQAASQAPATQSAVIQGLINRVVAPHIVADIAPEQGRYIASVDTAIATLMRDILHAPDFQALESAWRGVRSLLDETEGGEEVQLWLADVSAGDLVADIERAAEDPAKSAAFELLVARAERAADGQPWSAVVGNYLFGPGDDDLRSLSLLGALCRRAGALLLAGADSSLAGCRSFGAHTAPATWELSAADAAKWRALRGQPFASSVALALPRVLTRLPYGKGLEAIDAFAFEELDGADHESLPWGNAAFALGRLLIRGFMANGWDMEPGDELELAELPALVRGSGDDRKLQACAEAYVGERGGEKLLSLGLVPVLSYEQRAAVRLMRLQSIAEPAAPLSAAWT